MPDSERIVEGMTLTADGQAKIDAALTQTLIDLAIAVDDLSRHPVDVEHIVAAVILAVRQGDLPRTTRLTSGDERLLALLTPHVQTVFERFGGRVGEDD